MTQEERELQELAELEELAQLETLAAREQPAPVGGGDNLLSGVNRTLDYQRGAVGGPLLDYVAGRVSGKGRQFADQWAPAAIPFSGQGFPRSAEILEAHGVPELGSLEIPNVPRTKIGDKEFPLPLPLELLDKVVPGKYTGRGAAGAVLDYVTDPVTYETMLLGPYFKRLSEGIEAALKGSAERKAFDALRPLKVDVPSKTSVMQERGRAVLDSGALDGFFPTSERIADRLTERSNQVGRQLTEKIMEIDRKTPLAVRKFDVDQGNFQLTGNPVGIPPQFGVEKSRVRGAALERRERFGRLTPAQQRQFDKTADDYLANYPDFMTISQSEELKRNLNNLAQSGFQKVRKGLAHDLTQEERTAMALSDAARRGSEDAAEFVAKQLGTDDLTEFRKLKSDYGPLEQAERASTSRFRSDVANRNPSLTDYMSGLTVGGASAASGADPVTAFLIGATTTGANQYARKFGSAQAAKILDRARILPESGYKAFRMSPYLNEAVRGMTPSPWSVVPREEPQY